MAALRREGWSDPVETEETVVIGGRGTQRSERHQIWRSQSYHYITVTIHFNADSGVFRWASFMSPSIRFPSKLYGQRRTTDMLVKYGSARRAAQEAEAAAEAIDKLLADPQDRAEIDQVVARFARYGIEAHPAKSGVYINLDQAEQWLDALDGAAQSDADMTA